MQKNCYTKKMNEIEIFHIHLENNILCILSKIVSNNVSKGHVNS